MSVLRRSNRQHAQCAAEGLGCSGHLMSPSLVTGAMPRGTGQFTWAVCSAVSVHSRRGDRPASKPHVVHTQRYEGVRGVEIVPRGGRRTGRSAPGSRTLERSHAHTRTPGRTPPLQKGCLVALGDLLSFPRQGVNTSWSSLLESSRALPGRGREGSLWQQKLRSTDTICLLLTRYRCRRGPRCNVLGRFRGTGRESDEEPGQGRDLSLED